MRPLSVGELLDAAFSAVRRNFGALVLCTLVIVVPVSILNTLISASSNETRVRLRDDAPTLDEDDLGLVPGRHGRRPTLLSLLAQTLTRGGLPADRSAATSSARRSAAGESLRYARHSASARCCGSRSSTRWR